MRRLQLIELHEKKWMPAILRNSETDFLSEMLERYNVYLPVTELLLRIIEITGCSHIIDLCSGGSGPLKQLQAALIEKTKRDITVELTDLHPNIRAFSEIAAQSAGLITYSKESVDARNFKEDHPGIRTFFSSFHHFDPIDAKNILTNVTHSNMPIGIFEFTENKASRLLMDLITPISVLLLTLKSNSANWKRLVYTYLIPIMPLLVFFDGVVSNIRTYTPETLLSMAKSVNDTDYHWESGKLHSGFNYFKITYLIGYPK